MPHPFTKVMRIAAFLISFFVDLDQTSSSAHSVLNFIFNFATLRYVLNLFRSGINNRRCTLCLGHDHKTDAYIFHLKYLLELSFHDKTSSQISSQDLTLNFNELRVTQE